MREVTNFNPKKIAALAVVCSILALASVSVFACCSSNHKSIIDVNLIPEWQNANATTSYDETNLDNFIAYANANSD